MACAFVSICIMGLWWPLQSDYHAKCNYSFYCIIVCGGCTRWQSTVFRRQ
jgi:hypothetical protein